MNGNELTTRSENKMVTDQTWNTLYKQAAEIIKSGFLPPSIKTPAQAIAVILTGRELGIGMMEAFRGIHIIDNRPSISPQLMMSLIYNSGVAENIKIESTATECIVSGNRKGQPAVTIKFTTEDAKSMGLLFRDNWKKQQQNMLRWRAISAWARLTCPDVIGGLYTPEELENSDDVIGKNEATLELSEKLNTDTAAYDTWREVTTTAILDDLAACKIDSDVRRVNRKYQKDIGQMLDEDRQYCLDQIDSRLQEIITDAGPKGEPIIKEEEKEAVMAQETPNKATPEEILEAKEKHSQEFGRQAVADINTCKTKAALNVLKASVKFISGRAGCNIVMKEYIDACLANAYNKIKT